jgi:hypothetical protein
MDKLTALGLFAVSAMLVTYALESRNHWFTLAFAGACVLGSVYGFLQGAWPFGAVEAVWAFVAVNKWRKALLSDPKRAPPFASVCRWWKRKPE